MPASRLRLAPPVPASASRAVRAGRSGSAMLSQLRRHGAHREALALECKAMHLLCLSWRNSHRSCTAGHASCRRTCGVARGRSAGPAPPPAARATQRCNRRTALLFRRFHRYRARGRCRPLRSGSRRQLLAASSGRVGQPRQAGEASAPRSSPPTIAAHHTAAGRKHLELGGLR